MAWKETKELKSTVVFDAYAVTIQTLKGHVKLLVETYERPDHFPQIDSINFDISGNQIRKSVSESGGFYYAFNYNYKYDNGKKTIAVSDSGEVFKYDRNGRIHESIAGRYRRVEGMNLNIMRREM